MPYPGRGAREIDKARALANPGRLALKTTQRDRHRPSWGLPQGSAGCGEGPTQPWLPGGPGRPWGLPPALPAAISITSCILTFEQRTQNTLNKCYGLIDRKGELRKSLQGEGAGPGAPSCVASGLSVSGSQHQLQSWSRSNRGT